MKSLMRLLRCILADASVWCRASTTLDLKTIERRVEHEGISFLTITLPSFCQGFEESLASGRICASSFPSFKRAKKGSPLPAFLQGLVAQVFDPGTGLLRDEADMTAIFFVRQITLAFKKIRLECSSERVEAAYDRYITNEQEVRDGDLTRDADLNHRFASLSDLIWGRVLQPVNHLVSGLEHVPRHGPGATAERISGNGKYDLRAWHTRLERHFPSDLFAIPNWNAIDRLEKIDFLDPETETPVRVITVPKTLKTPRIIGIEPVCMQYTQQSLLEILVPVLEGSSFLQGALGFTDQTVNRELALRASATQEYATLDLSDASDRVSNQLVNLMLRSVPDLSEAVQACRSKRADVPGHGLVDLAKFASMGSALCFPIEAMVFLTIVVSGILRSRGDRWTSKDISDICGSVRIYGDDIIVPTEYAQSVMRELSMFNMKVNARKSFWTGKFRESCGMDAYDGQDVSVVKLTRELPTSRRDVSEVIATVSLYNQFYRAGMWRTCSYLQHLIERVAPFPVVAETSPILGRHSYLTESDRKDTRWNERYHRHEVRGLVISAVSRRSPLSGYGALMKFFLKRGIQPMHDVKHLERYGRPESVDTKLRWASIY